jgi:hypothetical protein
MDSPTPIGRDGSSGSQGVWPWGLLDVNFSFAVFPERYQRSLLIENTLGIGTDNNKTSLYVNLCSRFHKSNNIKLHTQLD